MATPAGRKALDSWYDTDTDSELNTEGSPVSAGLKMNENDDERRETGAKGLLPCIARIGCMQ